MRAIAAGLVLALLSGCTDDTSGNEDVVTTIDADQVLWDFRTPQTASGLGSRVDAFVELDGPARLRVVVPSGREVEGEYAWGALGQTALPPSPGHESGVINEVVLQEGSVTTATAVRRSAEAFVEEWGPASFRGEGIETFVERFEAFAAGNEAGAGFDDFAPVGENVFAFRADEQDGVDATWSPRVVSDAVTIRVTLEFDPGVP